MRRVPALLIAGTLLLAACGDDDGDDTEATAASATDPPATDPPATDPPATDPPATEPPASEPAPPVADGVPVNLVEWAVETESSLPAGPTTFAVTNGGNFPHEFGIARGPSYEELPLFDNGGIDEETLGDDFLGKTETIDPGGATTIDFELEPGTYVFFCNIIVGPNSHAAQGQVLTVTVG